jgi:hypothetical protein
LLSLVADPGVMAGTTRLAALPAASVIDYAWSRTGFVSRLAPSRRWGLTFSGESALNGGVGARSRAAIPFQTGLHGGVGAEHAASRRDHLTTSIEASRTVFSSGWQDTLLEGKLSWRHDLGRGTVATLAGGTAWASSLRDASAAASTSIAPILEAGITHRPRATPITLGLTVKLSPVVDGLTGRIDERLETIAVAAWSPTRALAVQGQLGLARSVPWGGGEPLSLGFGGVAASYRVSSIVQVDGGVRSAWASGPGIDAPPQWMVLAGATIKIPTFRF